MPSDSPVTQTRVSRLVAKRLRLAVQTLGFKGHDKQQRATDLLLTEAMNQRQVPGLAEAPAATGVQSAETAAA